MSISVDHGRSRNLLGILLTLGAAVAATGQDTFAKILVGSVPAFEIAALRFAVQIVFLAVWIAFGSRPMIASPLTWAQIARGLAMAVSSVGFVLGARYLPLAAATGIIFTAPAMITLLARVVLKETIGLRRWGFIAIGMVGVLLIVRPGAEILSWAITLPLLSAISWAIAAIIARKSAANQDVRTTLLFNAVIGCLTMGVFVPFDCVVPNEHVLWLLLPMGMSALALHFCALYAYQIAEASRIAPFSYLQLATSTLAGFWVFGNVPDRLTMLGLVVIAIAGVGASLQVSSLPREAR